MAYCPECAKEYPDDWKVCPQDESTLLKSQFIGKYKIEGVLGVGGMGAVYKGINPDTKAPVAIKVLHPSAATDDSARTRFQREAASISALTTRHLVNIYDFGAENDGMLFLVMEFLHGHSLREEVRNSARVPLQRINMTMDGALRGLGSAHRKGIIHRDLKPENIFVADTEDGEVVKVLDFGVAQVQTSNPSSVLTQEGALLGTPAYMAPEQVTGSRGEMGPWTDVYAMGVILYEMLTGATPFHAESMTAVLSKVLMREFVPLGALRDDLPKALVKVVNQAMSDQATERYRDAAQFREAWLHSYSRLGPAVTTATTPRFIKPLTSPDTAADPYSGTHAAGSSADQMATSAAGPVAIASAANASVTPGPVVVDSVTEHKPGRGFMWFALVVLVLGGAIATYVLTQRGDKTDKRIVDKDPSAAPSSRVDAAATVVVKVPADATPKPSPAVPPDMVRIDGGSFDMGVDVRRYRGFAHADPKHRVTLAGFLIDKTEMTVAKFKTTVATMNTPPELRGDQTEAQLPVRQVTWQEATAVCAAQGKRLPSEAEWEYVATRHPLDPKRARLLRRGTSGPAPVGSHPGDCNPLGVCDLLGNVSEWTADPARDKTGRAHPTMKMLRGGSFTVSPKSKFYASAHARMPGKPKLADKEVGFRCAKNIHN